MLSGLIKTDDERAELQASLRWDYSQLDDAETVIAHTIEIKRSERRASDAVIEAGRHLIAVKESLSHGQWGDWLATEFSMTDRTARTLMNIAERFDGKTEIISDLTPTVLGLLASPSVPEAAVEEVVAASSDGKVSVADAKAIINQHRPARPTASGLPALDMPPPVRTIQPGSPEAKPPAKPTYPEPPTRSQISGCVDTLAWEAALGSDEKRLAHMSAPENFSYYLEGVRTRLNFVVNHYSVKDVLAAHIERLRNDLAGAPAEPATPTPVVVDGDRPLPDWATGDNNTAPAMAEYLDYRSEAIANGHAYLNHRDWVKWVEGGRPTVTAELLDADDADTLTAADWQVLKPTPRADDAVIVMTQAEDKTMSLSRLIGVFSHTIAEFNVYGELTGHHVETLPAKRELEKLIARLEREIALLNGQPVEAWGEMEPVA